jgi:hypothetical protein
MNIQKCCLLLVSLTACDPFALLNPQPQCERSSDCGDNERCTDGACVVQEPECERDGDCRGSDVCDDGECVECADDRDCADGEVCTRNECELDDGVVVGEGEGEGGGEGGVIVRGLTQDNGYLEVEVDGVFGPICDDSFDIEEAIVACRQLGQPSAAPTLETSLTTASADFAMDDVVCVGTEATLGQCTFVGPLNHNCGTTEGVRVVCE